MQRDGRARRGVWSDDDDDDCDDDDDDDGDDGFNKYDDDININNNKSQKAVYR